MQSTAGLEAVSPHVLLGTDVVLHLQEALEDGLLLRRPAQPGKPLVQGQPARLSNVADTILRFDCFFQDMLTEEQS